MWQNVHNLRICVRNKQESIVLLLKLSFVLEIIENEIVKTKKD